MSKQKTFNVLKSAIIILLTVLTVACASSGNAPIENRAAPPSQKINTHIVESGDTLYSIAWRYEKNVKELAGINGLSSPYTIYKGQRLKLSGPVVRNVSRSPASTTSTAVVRTETRANSRVTTTASTPTTSTNTVKVPSSSTTAPIPTSVQGWSWPLQGKVVKSFGSSSLTKGMTIDTSQQKDVKAAAEGVVVYAGSGVRGYGNFLILKHSDVFLSAYAYNSQLTAKEGDQVRKGQKIAVAGKDMDGHPRLYFEIRKDGKPVDPVRYLPKR